MFIQTNRKSDTTKDLTHRHVVQWKGYANQINETAESESRVTKIPDFHLLDITVSALALICALFIDYKSLVWNSLENERNLSQLENARCVDCETMEFSSTSKSVTLCSAYYPQLDWNSLCTAPDASPNAIDSAPHLPSPIGARAIELDGPIADPYPVPMNMQIIL